MQKDIIPFIESMVAEDMLLNYAIPGLSSTLLTNCKPRLFEQNIATDHTIAPHSHRYDHIGIVLEGCVVQTYWTEVTDQLGVEFAIVRADYTGKPGEYECYPVRIAQFTSRDKTFSAGDIYAIGSEEIHSVVFRKGTKVLLLEGPQKAYFSYLLDPICQVTGEVIPVSKTAPWMFKTVKR
jgi:hypothetical protein